jgi:hypothetical protein
MPEGYGENSNTLVVEAEKFSFETVTQENGNATVIRFQLQNPEVRAGDVLLVLSGADIHFHGLIGKIEEGSAIATDRSSLLPSSLVH